ncbi:MAG: hypothetical protein M3Y64_05920, partial [Gemmatimonadota bacterium]|nr:hypothetical protein [Gemmatimonadota bacterium]
MNARTLGFTVAIAVSALASSAALAQTPPVTPPAQPAPQPGRGGGAGRGGIRVMTLTSPAWVDGAMIPARYSQQGRDVSPALSWT